MNQILFLGECIQEKHHQFKLKMHFSLDVMVLIIFILFTSFFKIRNPLLGEAKIFMVLMEEDPLVYNKTQEAHLRFDSTFIHHFKSYLANFCFYL